MDDFTRSMLAKPNEETAKYEPYEAPLLVLVYQVNGVLSFVAGFVVPMMLDLTSNGPIFGLFIFSGILAAVGSFGIAQLVDLGGRTEYHARKLHAIEAHLERIVKG
jgi:hypothetical protein